MVTEADLPSLRGVPLGTLGWLSGVGQWALVQSRVYDQERWGQWGHLLPL